MSEPDTEALEAKLSKLPEPEAKAARQAIAELRAIAAEIAPLAAELDRLEELLRVARSAVQGPSARASVASRSARAWRRAGPRTAPAVAGVAPDARSGTRCPPRGQHCAPLFRDTRSSRTICRIGFSSTKNARRIRPIVSTVSIPGLLLRPQPERALSDRLGGSRLDADHPDLGCAPGGEQANPLPLGAPASCSSVVSSIACACRRQPWRTASLTWPPPGDRRRAACSRSRCRCRLSAAAGIGPNTAKLTGLILESRRYPEQGYRLCLGILRLARQYGAERLKAARDLGLDIGARSYCSIQLILERGLDRQPRRPSPQGELVLPAHPNLRGPRY